MDGYARLKLALQMLADSSTNTSIKVSFGNSALGKLKVLGETLTRGQAYREPGFVVYLLRSIGGLLNHRQRPVCTWSSATQVQVLAAAGAILPMAYLLQDYRLYTLSSAVTWNPSVGVQDLGLDVGAEANSTWYYLYLVPSATTAGALTVRGSITAPAAGGPTGYAAWLYVGPWYNNSSGDIEKAYQAGPEFAWAKRQVLLTGSGVSDASATSLSLAGGAPATATLVDITGYFTVGAGAIASLLLWTDGEQAGSLAASALAAIVVADTANLAVRIAQTANRVLYHQRKTTLSPGVSELAAVGWRDSYL